MKITYSSNIRKFICHVFLLNLINVKGLLRFEKSVYEVEEENNNYVTVTILQSNLLQESTIRCELKDDFSDFLISSQIATFSTNETSTACRFLVNDDNIPETKETFPISITVLSGESLDPSSTAVVIIKENDNPNGCIAFANFPDVESINVDEPISKDKNVVTYNLTRYGGKIGSVYVNWKVLKGINEPVPDIQPYSGSVYFAPQQVSANFQINVLPDDIPEALEIFTIQLYNVSGGACLWSNSSEVALKINENDALIRFKDVYVTFNEPEIKRVELLRGIGIDGNRVGPVSEEVSVFYRTYPGSAEPLFDYEKMNGKVVFERQTTRKELSIEVKADEFPELHEYFFLELYNATPGIILNQNRILNVTILKNDDPHGVISFKQENNQNYIIQEDLNTLLNVPVKREKGSFGDISVFWTIENTNSESSLPKFKNEYGHLFFSNKKVEKNITLSLVKDVVPSEASIFLLVLKNTTGGARFESSVTNLSVSVIVSDGDMAYGEIYFSNQTPVIDLSTTPRSIKLFVSRAGGLFGDVQVEYSVLYFLTTSSVGDANAVTTSENLVIIYQDQNTATTELHIRNDIFLSSNSYFIVEIKNVTLLKNTLVPPSSPNIRQESKQLKINVSSEFANGEIAFFQTPIELVVEESQQNVSLKIMRDGTASEATVFWQILGGTSTFIEGDVVMNQGYVTFQKGESLKEVYILINNDDIPELDELFFVDLINVTSSNDKLRQGATRASITIKENDNPEGYIEFQTSQQLFIKEGEFKSIKLIRKGGTLKNVVVLVTIVDGKADFTTYSSLAEFNVGDTRKEIIFQARDDVIPELVETFEIQIKSFEAARLGNNTKLLITILENDNPFGLISFLNDSSNLQQKIFESRDFDQRVSFILIRSFGLFKALNISWYVTNEQKTNNMTDIYPIVGNVYFASGQSNATINIYISRDEEPEIDERFHIQMSNISNGGQIIQPSIASLTILANDFPVSLTPLLIHVDEGDIAILNVTIPKIFPIEIHVQVRITPITGSGDDIFPLNNKTVTIFPGNTAASFNIRTVNDSIPELNEMFSVELVSSSGDTTISDNRTSTLVINESDYPYGIFSFIEDEMFGDVMEGMNFSVIIKREFGGFDNVTLVVDVVNVTNKIMPLQSVVEFRENVMSNTVTFFVQDDKIANLNEFYMLSISNVTGGSAQKGGKSTILIQVLSDDFPAGLFEVNVNETDRVFEEDKNEHGSLNSGNITIQRKFGAFYSAELYWQIFPFSEDLIVFDVVNLLLLPLRSIGVTNITQRNFTQSKAVNFSQGSFVESSFPHSNFGDDGYAIGLWLKPVSSNLMRLFQNGDNELELLLDTRIRSNVIIYYSFKNETDDKVTVKVPVPPSVDIINGLWHSLFLSHSFVRSSIVFFIDGEAIVQHVVSGQPNITNSSVLIGYNQNNDNMQYYGGMQDIWIFNKYLSNETCRLLSSHDIDFNPTSGIVNFDVNVQRESFTIETLDDEIAEENKNYILKLIAVNDNAPLRDEAKINVNSDNVPLTVLKSDFANGLFQITSCHGDANEGQVLLFQITRSEGLFGDVILKWSISNDSIVADDDFRDAYGDVLFRAGEFEKNISIFVVNDEIAELDEYFVFNLTSATVQNETTKPVLQRSSASFNETFRQCNFKIFENDYPYGVLQLMDTLPDLSKPILPVRNADHIFVEEEIGNVNLYIVRAQGNIGEVGVQWQTKSIKAVDGTDYRSSFQEIRMAEGQQFYNISIKIIDNDIPELEKTFKVEMQNPIGGAALLNGKEIFIHIKPSDDSLGTFSIDTPDLIITEGSNFSIVINRVGGTLDGVYVKWRINNGQHDFNPSFGVTEIGRDERRKVVNISCTNDELPELKETFTMEIYNVSGGKINKINGSTTITILPNDHVYGLFSFEQTFYTVTEDNGILSMKIQRNKGTQGVVRVTIAVINGSANQGDDFNVSKLHVDFQPGQKFGYVNITIINDMIPEIDENFLLNIVDAALQDDNTAVPNESMIGFDSESNITILTNDNANGVLQFSSQIFTVAEDEKMKFVSVTRRGGSFGQISFTISVEPISATLGSDFNVESFEIHMKDGERIVFLPIYVTPDDIPEVNETFRVSILKEKLNGGVTLHPDMISTLVVILENDYPYGLIGFSLLQPRYVSEPDKLRSIIGFEVSRSQGESGITQVKWRLSPANSSLINDIEPRDGTIAFLTGTKAQNISIAILPDDIPEIDEVFTIELITVSSGLASIDLSRSKINFTVLANDNPHGIVSFGKTTQNVNESDHIVNVNVVRTKGLFGDLKIFYRTLEKEINAQNKATSNSDYVSVVNRDNFIIIKDGTSTGNIPITILNDTIPELNEEFFVKLELVQLLNYTTSSENAPKIQNNEMTITILENDFPFGLFEMTVDLKNVQVNDSKYYVYEPTEGSTTITIIVERKMGSFKEVSTSWEISPIYTIDPEKDITSTKSGRLEFKESETSNRFTIEINSDNEPEADEMFTIRLSNPMGGALISPINDQLDFVIFANDGIGGVIKFHPDSLSISAQEGETISLMVERSSPSLGNAFVYWEVKGNNAEQDFDIVKGNLLFLPNDTVKTIQIKAVTDTQPEVNEEFKVVLLRAVTHGISESGWAVIDESSSQAVVTLGASDNPHGVFAFLNSNQVVRVDENIAYISLVVVRKFGNIGSVIVSFNLETSRVNNSFAAASLGNDVASNNLSIIFANGETSKKLQIQVIDDEIPEIDESFGVKIVKATLQSVNGTSNGEAQIEENSIVYVVINSNDGANGQLSFDAASTNVVFKEEDVTFNLTVVRTLGTFGDVFCYYYLLPSTANQDDFYINGGVMENGFGKLVFLNGERHANITVRIFDDDITEDTETFKIGLTLFEVGKNGGATITHPRESTVTILPSDDAYGIIEFHSSSANVTIFEPQTLFTNILSSHTFLVERKVGQFGDVSVSWKISGENVNKNLKPISGLLQFDKYISQRSFEVSVLPDDVPELDMVYEIQLQIFSSDAKLGNLSSAFITIPANDNPNGLFRVNPHPSTFVDELHIYQKISVIRDHGTFGTVSISYSTESITALSSSSGNITDLDTIFSFEEERIISVLSFTAYNRYYLLSSTNKSIILYRWHESFAKEQVFIIEKVFKMKSHSFNDQIFIFLVTHKKILVYNFQKNETLTFQQEIQVERISDFTLFESDDKIYLLATLDINAAGLDFLDLKCYELINGVFQPKQLSISTNDAQSVDVFQYKDQIFLVIANRFNSIDQSYVVPSNIYIFNNKSQRFELHGVIRTNKVEKMRFIEIDNKLFISVISTNTSCKLYRYNNNLNARFQLDIDFQLLCINIEKISVFGEEMLFISTTLQPLLYKYDSSKEKFAKVQINVPLSIVLYVFKLGTMEYLFIQYGTTNVKGYGIARFVKRGINDDFISKNGLLIFEDGTRQLDIFVTLVQDNLPEVDERFSVSVSKPTNGGVLSTFTKTDVIIMANNNAYGRFMFSKMSTNVTSIEDDHDTAIVLSMQREFGTFAKVTVFYNVTRVLEKENHNNEYDIYPTVGSVVFEENVGNQTLILYNKADDIPELEKTYEIRLLKAEAEGFVNDQPSINYLHNIALITIPANDDPYGIFGWSSKSVVIYENEKVNSSVVLILKRLNGVYGSVNVSYHTVNASKLRKNERLAIPFIDYEPVNASIVFNEGETEKMLYFKVFHREIYDNMVKDGNADFNEVFQVTISSVYLLENIQTTIGLPIIDKTKQNSQVIITDVIQNNGVIEFSSSTKIVEESSSNIFLTVLRRNGLDGIVGAHFEINFINASAEDINVPIDNHISFNPNETTTTISVNIIDDDIAELMEMIKIVLVSPFGGARIGARNEISLIIEANDFPYGLISFPTNASHISVTEGSEVTIPVQRLQGLVGNIEVRWECDSSFYNDIKPSNGLLNFNQGVSLARIKFTVIDDNVAEVNETFLCQLLYVSGMASLSGNNVIQVTIMANDKPFGIFSIDETTKKILAKEPEGGDQEYSQIFIRILRNVGQVNNASISWKIDNSDKSKAVLLPSQTFDRTFGTVLFEAGVKEKNVTLNILADNVPEETTYFTFSLFNPTDGAQLIESTNSTSIAIIVAASDNPYGIFTLQSDRNIIVQESVGQLSLFVLRSRGFIGRVKLYFNVTKINSHNSVIEDITPLFGEIIFLNGESTSNVTLTIVDDTSPELTENFRLQLTSAILLSPQIDFQESVGDVTINTPPLLINNAVNISIAENDNPYGTIEFAENKIVVDEEIGTAKIRLIRKGGLFGSCIITYAYVEVTAKIFEDFRLTSNTITFNEGENTSYIQIEIINDSQPESEESFKLQLLNSQCNANLGNLTQMAIVIETSDNPYGLIGFFKQQTFFVNNPITAMEKLDVPIVRLGGGLGTAIIKWRIERKTASDSLISEDITPENGEITFNDLQNGTLNINLHVAPYGGPQEREETFLLKLVSIDGKASIDQNVGFAQITIGKKGFPSGLFVLSGSIQPSDIVDEPIGNEVVTRLLIPIQRKFGTNGNVMIMYHVRSIFGTPVNDDVALPANTSVVFNDGENVGYIVINVTADDEPELDEIFEVMLMSANNDGSIKEDQRKINFTIRANDNPFGEFFIESSTQKFVLNKTSLQRTLRVFIQRRGGDLGEVTIVFSVNYLETLSRTEVTVIGVGRKNVTVDVHLPSSAYLAYQTSINVELVKVEISLLSPVLPRIDVTQKKVSLQIPELFANALVIMSNEFVVSDITTGTTTINVERSGLYGSVVIFWKAGVLSSKYGSIGIPGAIIPAEGNVTIAHGQREASFSVRADVPIIIDKPYVYAVYLTDVGDVTARFSNLRNCIINPHGVIQISSFSLNITVLEGKTTQVTIERAYSVIGELTVSYRTRVFLGKFPAQPGEDFLELSSSVVFKQGEYRKDITLSTVDDSLKPKAEQIERFYFELTLVKQLDQILVDNSPRIYSSRKQALINIQDNDDPYGIIAFINTSLNVLESRGEFEVIIKRTGGKLSDITFDVSTVGGGETWTSSVLSQYEASSKFIALLNNRKNSAIAGKDYTSVRKTLTFPESSTEDMQQQSVKIQLIKDSIAEPTKAFGIVLHNVKGGASIFLPESFVFVSIDSEGFFNGEIGFRQTKATLDEDGTRITSITVKREGEALEAVEVTWKVTDQSSNNVLSQLRVTSGRVTIFLNETEKSFDLEIFPDEIAELESWFYVNITSVSQGAIIQQSRHSVNVTILASDFPAGRFAFNENSRFPVQQLSDTELKLTVIRMNGTLLPASVQYETVSLVGPITDSGLRFNPAVEGRNYNYKKGTLIFNEKQTEGFISIILNPEQSTGTSFPIAFNVTLKNPTNGASIHSEFSSSRVVVTDKTTRGQFLKLRSIALNLPLTDTEIQSVLARLLGAIESSSLDEDNQQLTKGSIQKIIDFKSSLPVGKRSLTTAAQKTLLDTFNILLSPTRQDTSGKSFWMTTFEKVAYHFLSDLKCPSVVTHIRDNFKLEVQRKNGSAFNGVSFTSGDNFLRYPINMFPSNGVATDCTDLHFVELNTAQWFNDKDSILSGKIFSSAVKNPVNKNNKIVYRINAPSNRITQTGSTCVIFEYPSTTGDTAGKWSSDNCKVLTQSRNYVECECAHMSEYAVLAKSDDRTGYEIYFFVSCFIVIGSCFLALLSFHLCSLEKTFTANLLIHFFFAVMVAQGIYVIGAYMSPSLLTKATHCSVLAMFLHYFYLSQFTTMFVQACNLWRILIMNDEHSYRRAIPFYLIAWGLPVVVVLGYIFVTHAVWDWSFNMMYSDVRGDGDVCFISNAYAAFSVAVIPVLLLILSVGVVFVQAYQVTPQWKYYDDIYRGRYNVKEVRHLMVLFGLLSIVWLFAGLHIAYGFLWLIIIFTVINCILGAYILIIYVILRNQMRNTFSKKYEVRQTLDVPSPLIYDVPPQQQKKHPDHMSMDWDNVELEHISRLTPIPGGSRRSVTPLSIKKHSTYGSPTLRTSSSMRRHGNIIRGDVNESYDFDQGADGTDFDDLIFALKSGGKYESVNKEDSIGNDESVEEEKPPRSASAAEQYAIRKIKIGDTHL